MANGCLICVNIVLDRIIIIINFFISRSSLILKMSALEVGDKSVFLFLEVLKGLLIFGLQDQYFP
jgi:hypothetical protein